MAWGTKYRIVFDDIDGNVKTVNFQWDGYGGSVTDLTPGAVPVKLRYHGGEKYKPIVGSEMEFQVVYDDNVEDFYVEADQAIRVHADFDAGPSTLVWYGYVSPFQSFKMMGTKPHYATILATDQLGVLKDIKFEDGSSDPYYGLDDDLAVMYNIIQKTGMGCSMLENVSIYEDNQNSDPTLHTPLDQTYFFQEMYWDDRTDERGDCYSVLRDIVKKYGARVFQSDNNRLYLWRPNALWAKFTMRAFTTSFVYDSDSTNYSKWNKTTNEGNWLARPYIEKIPRAGKVEIKTSSEIRPSAIHGATFKDFQYDGGTDYIYWSVSSADHTRQDGQWIINDKDAVGDPDQYVYQDVTIKDCKSFDVVIEFQGTYTGGGGDTCVLHFAIVSNTLYWNPATEAWQAGEVHYEFDVDSELGASMSDYATLTIPITQPLSGSQEYQLRIYEVEDNNDTTSVLYLRDVRVEPSYNDRLTKYEVSTQTNSVTSYNTIEDDIAHHDSWHRNTTTGEDDCFWGLRYSNALAATTYQWSITGDPTSSTGVNIQDLLARQYLNGFNEPLDKIKGTMKGDGYGYHQVIEDDEITDSYGYTKKFMPLDVTLDVHRQEWEGEWIEVAPVYTDEDLDWASDTYASAAITDNEIDIDETVSGTMTATSDAYTAVLGEMVRIKVYVINREGGDLPNYAYDGNTGELESGYNYLEFRSTAGSKTFQINHTDGETADCTVTFWFYSLKGI